MLHTWWFLIIGCTICTVRGFQASPLNVGIHESHCQQKVDVLFCDYADVVKEHVQLKRIQDDGLKKVFLYNIGNLTLSDSVCVNVALHNVENVELKNDVASSCDKLVELYVKKCNLNRIPSNITSLILIESNVSVLATSSSLSKLSIESSEVGEIVLNSSFVNGTKALIKDSRIFGLSRLVVGPGTSLEIQQSILNITERNGLETNNGSLSMKESSVTTKEDGVTLSSGATLTVENLKGQMRVLAKLCIDKCSKTPVNPNSTFVALFLITLFLLITTWTAMAYIVTQRKDILIKLSSDKKASKKTTSSGDADTQVQEEILVNLLDDCYSIEMNRSSSEKGQGDGEANGTKEPAFEKTWPTDNKIQHGMEDKQLDIHSDDTTDSNPVQEKTAVEEKEDDKVKEEPRTNNSYRVSGEDTESSKVDNSNQSNELLDKKMKLKSSIEEEKVKQQKEIADLYNVIGKANSISKESKPLDFAEIYREIDARCEIVTTQYNFLNFLQKREIYLLTLLALAKGSTTKADKEKMKDILEACDNFEKESCLSKDMFRKNMQHFSELLGVLTNPGSLDSCETPLRVPDEETKKCIQQLHRNSTYKKKEMTKPLEHIAQFILKDISHFGIQIQELYGQELKKKIELMESVCYYIMKELLGS